MWSLKSSRLTNPKLGVITRVWGDPKFAEPRLEIRLTDFSRVSLILRWTPPDYSLLGSIVILSEKDNLILHPEHAELPFHSFTVLNRNRPRRHNSPTMTMTKEDRIQAAIERIAKQAWAAVAKILSQEARLKQAKHETMRLIKKLPMSIRGQVTYRFASFKWEPLISRKPK
jgi:hypothetical protein